MLNTFQDMDDIELILKKGELVLIFAELKSVFSPFSVSESTKPKSWPYFMF